MKLHRIRALSRKTIVLIVGAAVLVLMIAYGVISAWAWSGYKGTYTGWQSSVKSKLDAAMGMPTESSDQRAKWLTALDSADKLAAPSNKCTVNVMYSWQRVIVSSLKQEVASCNDIQSSMDALHRSLSTVTANIRAEEAIAAILAEPLKSTNVSDAAYQAEIDAWVKAESSLNKIEAPNGVVGVKSAAVLTAGVIKTAWSELTAANVAQNASRYQTALNGLSQAYSGLNNVSNESKKALQVIGNAVQKSYDEVF